MQGFKPEGFLLNHDPFEAQSGSSTKQVQFGQLKLGNAELTSALTETHLNWLGEIHKTWFEDVNSGIKISEICTNPDAKAVKVGDQTPIKKSGGLLPRSLSSPPLFTPENKNENKRGSETISHQRKPDKLFDIHACHSTPGVESQIFSPSMGPGPVTERVGSVVKLPSIALSPLHNQKEETPQFVRTLLQLQTPSTINKTQETLSLSSFQPSQPTPQRLSKSLGAEADHNLSWTSSMATPLSVRKTTAGSMSCSCLSPVNVDSPQSWKPIIAKVLFAGDTNGAHDESKTSATNNSSEALDTRLFSFTEDEDCPRAKCRDDAKIGPLMENVEEMKDGDYGDIVEKETCEVAAVCEEPLKTVKGLLEEDHQLMVGRYHQDDENMRLKSSSKDQVIMVETMDVDTGPNDGSNNNPEMSKRQASDEEGKSSHQMTENHSSSNKRKADELKVGGVKTTSELGRDKAVPRSVMKVDPSVKNQSSEGKTDCQQDKNAKATVSLYGSTSFLSERTKSPIVDESKDSLSINSKDHRDMLQGGNVDGYVTHRDESGVTYCISDVKAEKTGIMRKEEGQICNPNQQKIEKEDNSNADSTEEGEIASDIEEDGWSDRLAILAETLNIPYEQMVAADKKARELQRVSLKCRNKLQRQHKVRSFDNEGIKVNEMLSPKHIKEEISSATDGNLRVPSEPYTNGECESQNKKSSFESKSDSSAHIKNSQTTQPLIGVLPKESIKTSNIEDTLAFFLATPPLMQKKRLSALPSISDKVEKKLQNFTEADENPSGGQQSSQVSPEFFQSSRGNSSKLDIKATPSNVNTSPDVYIFSPLTPNMTEAMLRVTEAISSSVENSGDSLDEKGLVVSRSGVVGLRLSPGRALNNDVNVHLSSPLSALNAEDNVAEDIHQVIKTDDGMEGELEHGGNIDTLDTSEEGPSSAAEESAAEESTSVADKGRKDASSSAFFPVKPKSSAFKLMYCAQETNLSRPKSFEWQKTAVLDEAFLENAEKKRAENNENFETTYTSLIPDYLPRKRKLNTGSKTSKCDLFQSFNTYQQEELKHTTSHKFNLDESLHEQLQAEKRRKMSDDNAADMCNRKNIKRRLIDQLEDEVTEDDDHQVEGDCQYNSSIVEIGTEGGTASLETSSKFTSKGNPCFQEMVDIGCNCDSSSSNEAPVTSSSSALAEITSRVENFADKLFGITTKKSSDLVENADIATMETLGCDIDLKVASYKAKALMGTMELTEFTLKDDTSYTSESDNSNGKLDNSNGKLDNSNGKLVKLLAEHKNSEAKSVTGKPDEKHVGIKMQELNLCKTSTSAPVNMPATPVKMTITPMKVPDVPVKVPVSKVFLNASEKPLEVSDKTLEDAKIKIEALTSGDISSITTVKVPVLTRFSNTSGKAAEVSTPAFQNAENKMEELTLGDVSSVTRGNRAVLTGFSNASGTPIEVSAKALKDAEMKMQEMDSDLFRESKISTGGVDEAVAVTMNACTSHVNDKKDKSPKNERNSTFTHQSKFSRSEMFALPKSSKQRSKKYDTSKDYSRIPKGFRPFKPPTMLPNVKPTQVDALSKGVISSPKNGKDQGVYMSSIPSLKIDVQSSGKLVNVSFHESEVDDSNTQLVSEIAAAEEAEMLYNFMRDEEDSVHTQLDSILTASSEKYSHSAIHLKQEELFPAKKPMSNICFEKLDKIPQIVSLNSTSAKNRLTKGRCDTVEISSHVPNSFISQKQAELEGLQYSGFHTANGSKVNISEDAMNRAREMYKDDETKQEDEIYKEYMKEDKQIQNGATSKAKKTKRKVTFSEESILKTKCELSMKESLYVNDAKAMLRQGELSSDSLISGGFNTVAPLLKPGSSRLGYNGATMMDSTHIMARCTSRVQTALGNKVTVSNQALDRAKKMIRYELPTIDDSHRVIKSNNQKETLSSSFSGFQTASGNKVNISKEALKIARKMMTDDSPSTDDSNEIIKSNPELITSLAQSNSYTGFQTASGNRVVTISKESLERAKKMKADDFISTVDSPEGMKSNEGVTSLPQSSSFSGFQTASGSEVSVSKESLERAKKMMADDFISTVDSPEGMKSNEGVTSLPQSSSFSGFQTASGRKVSVSKESLERAKKMMADDFISTVDSPEGMKSNEGVTSLPQSSSFSGFQTASGRKVSVSKESLVRAKKMMADDFISTVDSPEGMKSNEGVTSLPQSSSFSGFQTASGSKVSISKESLERAKKMMADDFISTVDSPEGMKSNEGVTSLPQSSSFSGFQTASGSKVSISKESLERAKKMMADDFISTVDSPEGMKSNEGVTSLPQSSSFSGFQTASGNKVSISKESLERAKKMMADDFISTVDSRERMKSNEGVTSLPQSSSFSGFQTASGNKVSVSKESLERAKKMMADDFISTVDSPEGMKSNEGVTSLPQSSSFSGFQTASGSKVSISKESLERAKKMMADDFISTVDSRERMKSNEGVTSLPQSSSFSGFQTASGNKVSVSKESLERAKKMMADDFISTVDSPEGMKSNEGVTSLPQSSSFSGFQTASGSKVSISKESLERAKKMMADEVPSVSGKFGMLQTFDGFKQGVPYCNSETLDGNHHARTSEYKPNFSDFQTAGVSKQKVDFEEAEDISARDIQETGLSYFECWEEKKMQCCSRYMGQLKRSVSAFQTLGDSQVAISDSALLRRKLLVSKEFDTSSVIQEVGKGLSKTDHKDETVSIVAGDVKVCGFQTASGSSVEISKAALERAKQLLDDEETREPSGAKLSFENCSSFHRNSEGYSAHVASSCEKRSTFSKDSSDGTKDLLRGTSAKSSAGSLLQERNAKGFSTQLTWNGVGGFMTGNGNAVTISESALRKAKEKWDEDTWANEPVGGHTVDLNAVVVKSGCSDQLKGEPQRSTLGIVPAGITEVGQCEIRNIDDDQNVTEGKRENKEWSAVECGKKTGLPNSLTVEDSSPRKFPSQLQQQKISVTKDCSQVMKQEWIGGRHTSTHHKPLKVNPSSCLTDCIIPSGSFKALMSELALENQPTIRQPSKQAKLFERRFLEKSCKDEAFSDDIDLKLVWQIARLAQAKRIQVKKKLSIKPVKGALSKLKADSHKVTLREAVNHKIPRYYPDAEIFSAGVLPTTLLISAESASSYKFEGAEFFSQETLASQDGILSGDGGRLVLGDDGAIGVEEFTSAFLDTPGVEPSLVSSDWVKNHYKWIVWKLASMEVAYPYEFGGRLLTPDRVLLQMKLRYDREVDQSQRSALKKILERDEAASRRMVLCVAGIHKTETGNPDDQLPQLEGDMQQLNNVVLTDGWYSLRTVMDAPLSRLVDSGKINIGTKLCVVGSELVGSQEACSPLEVPNPLVLKISYNSTRRAKFDARLGIQRDPRPFPVPLRSVHGNGGIVSCVDVVIARVYPTQYMEKYPDGSSVFRSLRAEEKAAAEFLKTKQSKMETIYAKIQKKFEEKNAKVDRKENSKQLRKFTEEDITLMTTGREIFAALSESCDPGSLEACLSAQQVGLLQDYQRSLREKQNQDIQEELRNAIVKQDTEGILKRNVVTMVKIRITDYYGSKQGLPASSSMLTIWRPSEDLMTQLKEGKRFQITSLSASGARFQWGSSNAQLASTRLTRYLELPCQEDLLDKVYHSRKVTPLSVLKNGCLQSEYAEVDVVGLVVSVVNERGNSQKVIISDQNCKLVEVKLWNGLRAHHLQEVVKPGYFITASNLQVVRHTDRASLHVTELSLISCNPKAKLLQEALQGLKKEIKDIKELLKKTEGAMSQLMHGEKKNDHHSRTPTPSGSPQRTVGSMGKSVFTSHFVPFQGEPKTPKHSNHPGGSALDKAPLECSQFTKGLQRLNNDGVGGLSPLRDDIVAKTEDAERRKSLLTRIPSPPPLTPLPNKPSSHLRREFRTPRRKSEMESNVEKTHDTPNIPSQNKVITCTRNNEEDPESTMSSCFSSEDLISIKLPSTKSQAVRNSLEVMTDTQQARKEVSELSDGEILELQESWSQSLSYSSPDEAATKRKDGTKTSTLKEVVIKDGIVKDLFVGGKKSRVRRKDEDGIMNGKTDGNEDAGFEVVDNKGDVKSLSRRKRTKQNVDVGNKRRKKESRDLCQSLSDTNDVETQSFKIEAQEPQRQNGRQNGKMCNTTKCKEHALPKKLVENLRPESATEIVGVNNCIQVFQVEQISQSKDQFGQRFSDVKNLPAETGKVGGGFGENLKLNVKEASNQRSNITPKAQRGCEKIKVCSQIQDSFSSDLETQNNEIRENSETLVSQSDQTPSQRGRNRQRKRRSNVNLALLDEINLREYPENEGLSSRLRRKPRPYYRD